MAEMLFDLDLGDRQKRRGRGRGRGQGTGRALEVEGGDDWMGSFVHFMSEGCNDNLA